MSHRSAAGHHAAPPSKAITASPARHLCTGGRRGVPVTLARRAPAAGRNRDLRDTGRNRNTLARAALVGGAVTVAADHLGAYAFHDVNLPVGVVTGAFGAPFLFWLLTVSRRTA